MHGDREEKRSKTPPCRRSALRSAAHQNELDKLQKAISQYDAAIERRKCESFPRLISRGCRKQLDD